MLSLSCFWARSPCKSAVATPPRLKSPLTYAAGLRQARESISETLMSGRGALQARRQQAGADEQRTTERIDDAPGHSGLRMVLPAAAASQA